MNRLLVFGGRDFTDSARLYAALDEIRMHVLGINIVIHGGARGADELAGEWAMARGIHVARVNALWDALGYSAGPRRNEAMLTLAPEYAVGFPGGRGTADMARKLAIAGIPTWFPYGARVG